MVELQVFVSVSPDGETLGSKLPTFEVTGDFNHNNL